MKATLNFMQTKHYTRDKNVNKKYGPHNLCHFFYPVQIDMQYFVIEVCSTKCMGQESCCWKKNFCLLIFIKFLSFFNRSSSNFVRLFFWLM